MKKAAFVHLDEYQATPVSFWAHRHLDADAWWPSGLPTTQR